MLNNIRYTLGLVLLLVSSSQALAADRPNILFIITDQHHARMLSSAGNPYLKTRALDSMAKSGIRFSRAYVTNPVCVASRISMATGMMAGRFGVFNNRMKVTTVTPAKLIRKDYNERDWRNYRWICCRLTERVDAQIGRLLDALDQNGLDKNTLIAFTSDHGDMDGSHRLASKNVFYENSVGVPFIMQYKGVIPAGVVDDRSLISNGLDVLPTLCDYAGVSIPDYLLGRTIRPLAEGQGDNARRPYIVAENSTGRILRSDRFKYCVYTDGTIRESLVDLQTDSGEMKNLAGLPEFCKSLNQQRNFLQPWIAESNDNEAKSFAIALTVMTAKHAGLQARMHALSDNQQSLSPQHLVMNTELNRRNVLRGAGALIALPALESIAFRRFASAADRVPAKPPKRMVFLGFGFGVTQETWFPDLEQTGTDYDLPDGLKPLSRHKNDFTVVQGCSNQFSNEAHWGSTFWLTGANRFAVPGQNMSNSISADQVAARELGQDTRFASIQLGSSDGSASGHGPGLSLAWDQRGKPVAGFDDPVQVFHKLFSADDLPLEQRQAAIAENRSVLDAVLTEARRVQRGLTKTDKDKLEEYFQGIRDIETRLSKDEAWLEVPKAQCPIDEPEPGLKGREEIEVMYDLIVAALQTDSTRVMTYRMPGQALLQSMDITLSAHNVSHYSPGQRMQASQARDKTHSELLAGLIDKLKATKEADGSSLFDHVSLAFGSNISSIHYLTNCPTVLTGGGANLKLGQHLVLPKDTPLCNVWLTMLQGMGINVLRHGNSTGVVKELLA